MDADALILSGGKNTRMNGKAKGDLIYNNQTFLEHIVCEFEKETKNIMISCGSKVIDKNFNYIVVIDEKPDCGPIGGICSGLKKSKNNILMVAACDMPMLKIELFRYLYDLWVFEEKKKLKSFDGVVPIVNERIYSLSAIYRKHTVKIFEKQMEKSRYKMMDALKQMDILYIDLGKHKSYIDMLQNINTVAEYEYLINSERLR